MSGKDIVFGFVCILLLIAVLNSYAEHHGISFLEAGMSYGRADAR